MNNTRTARQGKPCLDCGLPTWNPLGKSEWYMVRDEIWGESGAPTRLVISAETKGYYLCIGCLEARLGRKLTRDDFTDAPVNELSRFSSDRLNERLTS